MKENQYTTYYKGRSTEELKEISFQESLYEDEARLAALLILKERNKISTDEELSELEKLKKNQKAKKQALLKQELHNKAKVEKETILPELYSPVAILGFSILFPLLFGGVLMYLNLRKLNKKSQAINSLLFCLGFMFLSGFASMKLQLNNQWVFIILNLVGAWLLIEYFWKKYIGIHQKFKKRPIVKAGLISVLIYLLMIGLLYYFFKDQFPVL